METASCKDSTILIIDDDQAVRSFLERYLRLKGFSDVASAETGQEALDTLRRQKKQIVFLDIKMSGMNGVEVLRQIKEIDKETAVIMMTGFPEQALAQEALKEGAYDYIIKPFNLEYLELSLLSKLLCMKPEGFANQ